MYCGSSTDALLTVLCSVKHKDNLHEFVIDACCVCYGLLKGMGRDTNDRTEFPIDSQVVLYKIKSYKYPPRKKDKELKEWQLFSALRTAGKKKHY